MGPATTGLKNSPMAGDHAGDVFVIIDQVLRDAVDSVVLVVIRVFKLGVEGGRVLGARGPGQGAVDRLLLDVGIVIITA